MAQDETHRITVREGSDRVRVLHGEAVIADSRHPRLLHETGYPTRYYLPPQDVRTDLLSASDTRTHCPFKGDATYWSVRDGGPADVVWAYPDPKPAVAEIRDHLCFHAEHPDITVEVTEPGG